MKLTLGWGIAVILMCMWTFNGIMTSILYMVQKPIWVFQYWFFPLNSCLFKVKFIYSVQKKKTNPKTMILLYCVLQGPFVENVYQKSIEPTCYWCCWGLFSLYSRQHDLSSFLEYRMIPHIRILANRRQHNAGHQIRMKWYHTRLQIVSAMFCSGLMHCLWDKERELVMWLWQWKF